MKLPMHMSASSRVSRWLRTTCAVFLVGSAVLTPLSFAADAELKSIAPKVDNSTPTDAPKKLRPLMGSVQHSDKGQSLQAGTGKTASKSRLNSSASTNQAKLGVKNLMNSLKARSDDSTLKAKVKDDQLRAQANSSFGIIGVKFVLTLGRPPVINRVFPGTPAWEKGLQYEDQIVAVDGVPTMGLTKDEVYDLIIGSPGTTVALTIMRNGDFMRTSCMRMDINEIRDPMVRRDYMMHM